jgi:hypothetical protein
MHTVRETATFSAAARVLLTAGEYDAVINAIAADPAKGVLVPGTGGVRKLRVASGGRGKSGGARAIYFYFDADHPVHAITIFGKSEKADLSAKERAELRKLTDALKAAWRQRK